MKHPIIPEQLKGGSHDIVSMHCANTVDKAQDNYEELQRRLTAVNEWHTFSEKIKAEFVLVDPINDQSTDELKVGNLIRIDIPGPGSPSGSGYDWTEITNVETGNEGHEFPFFSFTVKPCPAPDTNDDTVAHFYNKESTNTFIVRRIGTCIYVEVHGRNQIENTSDAPLLDIVRNKAVAIGSKFGIGSLNWTGFTSGLLEPFDY
ncbi:hypothetical protein [Gelidibacter gilvus]|uniref:Uncharacterized protein n=1 Tax=Gelidibacter gilvus TaxID=59602 RepID=A0A4Q0XDE7_9FLAO|nr:hypothetical protein [Gelidibacter gilvus]RXJ44350.1 hypothetical protein ESZ48_18295 [Gelidibacter gilvus]